MPITFTEVVAAGDILPANRHVLSFPTLPTTADGRILEIRHAEVTLPQFQVGQVQTRVLGYAIAFSGIRMMTNTFTANFYDTTGSPVVKTLTAWQDRCAGLKTHRAQLKAKYAVNSKLVAYDTTGKSSLHIKLINVWPINITYGNFTEDSSPQHIEVEFSVDAMDIEGVTFNTDDFELAGSVTNTDPKSSINVGPYQVQRALGRSTDNSVNNAINDSWSYIKSFFS